MFSETQPYSIKINYEIVGQNKPHYMFFSGIHGDEGSICKPLETVLSQFPLYLPSYLKLLQANPIALKLGVRGIKTNGIISDSNRHFGRGNPEESVSKQIMEIITSFSEIEYIFSFHEEADKNGYTDDGKGGIEIFERDFNSFYLYDAFNVGQNSPDDIKMIYDDLTKHLIDAGFNLYTGYDDYKEEPRETVQLNPVIEGYCPQPSNKDNFMDGTFENWVITKGAKRSFVFEIPLHIDPTKKRIMIDIIFDKFIIPFLTSIYSESFQ